RPACCFSPRAATTRSASALSDARDSRALLIASCKPSLDWAAHRVEQARPRKRTIRAQFPIRNTIVLSSRPKLNAEAGARTCALQAGLRRRGSPIGQVKKRRIVGTRSRLQNGTLNRNRGRDQPNLHRNQERRCQE